MTARFQSLPEFYWIFTTHPTFLLNFTSMKSLISEIGKIVDSNIEELNKQKVINLDSIKHETESTIQKYWKRMPEYGMQQKMTPTEEAQIALLAFTSIHLPWIKLMIRTNFLSGRHTRKFNPSPKMITWFKSDCDRSLIDPYAELPKNFKKTIDFMIDYYFKELSSLQDKNIDVSKALFSLYNIKWSLMNNLMDEYNSFDMFADNHNKIGRLNWKEDFLSSMAHSDDVDVKSFAEIVKYVGFYPFRPQFRFSSDVVEEVINWWKKDKEFYKVQEFKDNKECYKMFKSFELMKFLNLKDIKFGGIVIANFEDPQQLEDLYVMLTQWGISTDLIPLFEDNDFLTADIVKSVADIYKKNPALKKAVMVAGSDMRVNSGIHGFNSNEFLVRTFKKNSVELDYIQVGLGSTEIRGGFDYYTIDYSSKILSALKDHRMNVTIQGMQACTDPLWPFTLDKMMHNTHRLSYVNSSEFKERERGYFEQLVEVMETKRKSVIFGETFQNMVINNQKLQLIMNRFNYASRTKDFSQTGFVYKNQRAITLSKANFCMQIQPELIGWAEAQQVVMDNQSDFTSIYNTSDLFQLMLFNHCMLYHSAHNRKYIQEFNANTEQEHALVQAYFKDLEGFMNVVHMVDHSLVKKTQHMFKMNYKQVDIADTGIKMYIGSRGCG